MSEEAREVNPFTFIQRGEDSLTEDGDIAFADFSPRPVPADAVEEEITPKDESAPELAPSAASAKSTGQKTQGKNAQTPASKAAGKPSQNESSKQTSSSSGKTG